MKMEGDWVDFALSGLFTLATAVTVDIASVQLFDTSFSDGITLFGSSEFTVAALIGIATLGIMFITNDNTDFGDLKEFDDVYSGALVLTAALTVGIPLIPQLGDFITSSDLLRTTAVGVMSVGYGTAAWIR